MQQKYQLSPIQQLVNLNGDAVNFKLAFKATGPPDKEYQAVVVSQQQLDSGKDIEYKKVKGSIGGEMVSDKDTYSNYFLALRSEEPLEVVVEINFEKLPYPLLPPDQVNPQTSKKSFKKYLVIGVVVLALGAVAYYYFIMRKKKQKDINKSPQKSPPKEKSYIRSPIKQERKLSDTKRSNFSNFSNKREVPQSSLSQRPPLTSKSSTNFRREQQPYPSSSVRFGKQSEI